MTDEEHNAKIRAFDDVALQTMKVIRAEFEEIDRIQDSIVLLRTALANVAEILVPQADLERAKIDSLVCSAQQDDGVPERVDAMIRVLQSRQPPHEA